MLIIFKIKYNGDLIELSAHKKQMMCGITLGGSIICRLSESSASAWFPSSNSFLKTSLGALGLIPSLFDHFFEFCSSIVEVAPLSVDLTLKKKCNMHKYYSAMCTGTHRISHYFNMNS
jgi:hypothetical protein